MKVLSFSYCFPNHANPIWGVFVQQRLAAMTARVELQVASPVPSFPVVSRFRASPGPETETWQGLAVHRPRFLCFPGVLKSQDARLYARGLRGWFDRFVQTWRPDVLDAHFVWPDGVGVSLLARRAGLPYSITLRGKIYPCLEVPSQKRQCAEALCGASAVISVSSPMAEIARELGVRADRLHVILNGVDIERFCPRDRAAARRELGLPVEGRLIVTVAHLGPRKGHRETIQALAELPEDVRLVIVGGDPDNGHNERALRELAAEKGLSKRVVFAGQQDYDRVPRYFNAADVSVLASYREGCPNTVLESLASGVPVVASAVGAVPDMIDDGRNGRIVTVRQVGPLRDALAESLGKTWSPSEVRASRAVRTWAQVADEVLAVLGAACGAG